MENLLPFERIERKILVRKESETDYKYGCNPEQQEAGILEHTSECKKQK